MVGIKIRPLTQTDKPQPDATEARQTVYGMASESQFHQRAIEAGSELRAKTQRNLRKCKRNGKAKVFPVQTVAQPRGRGGGAGSRLHQVSTVQEKYWDRKLAASNRTFFGRESIEISVSPNFGLVVMCHAISQSKMPEKTLLFGNW